MVQEKEFIGLYVDRVFKHIFSKEVYLVDLLNSYFEYLGLSLYIDVISINKQSYVQNDNIRKKDSYLDILTVLSDGTYLNIEMYNYFGETEKKKSLYYATAIYRSQLVSGASYDDLKKVISLNFISNKLKDNYSHLVNKHKLYDLVNKVNYLNEDMEMILICLDKLGKMKYSKSEKRFITWCRMINAKSDEELLEYAKGDDIFMQLYQDVNRYTSKTSFLEIYHQDDWKLDSAMKRGIEQGIEQGTLTMARNMLSRDYPIKEVSELTNIPVEELKKLEY